MFNKRDLAVNINVYVNVIIYTSIVKILGVYQYVTVAIDFHFLKYQYRIV